MSLAAVRAALETQLDATLTITVAWENVSFVPTTAVPYAQAYLMPAAPDNPEIGPAYVELGQMQVSLFYPKDEGPGAATTTAEAVRAAFPIGASFVNSGTVVNITRTPEIGPARPDADFWMVPVKVRYSAFIGD